MENKKIVFLKGGKQYEYNIDTVIKLDDLRVFMYMDDDEVPDNNVIAVDEKGNLVWRIEDIISFKYPEAYVAMSKVNERVISIISYNGVRFSVDVFERIVVGKQITK